MSKDLIIKRFAKCLSTYNSNAHVQKQMAEHLLASLGSRKSFNNILEIGCGSGVLTSLANENLNFNVYTANDIVNECEAYIKKINSDIKFISGDIETILAKNQAKYDLIISNASLQWVSNLPSLIFKLVNNLNKDGVLLFSTFGKENFREIAFVQGIKLNYYSKSEICTMFKELTPVVEEEIRIMAFKTPKEVLKHIQKTGVNSLEESFWTKQDFKNFENGYNNICSKSPTLTYNPIYVKICI